MNNTYEITIRSDPPWIFVSTLAEQTVISASFIRIDVPETKVQPSFTKLLNPSAIYAINPVTPEVMHEMVQQMEVKPIESWDIRVMQEKLLALKEPEGEEVEV